MENIDEKKTKYFVAAIILLILLGVILIIHFNNKSLVKGDDTKTTKKQDVEPTSEVVTTKKQETKNNEEVAVLDIYKSTVDEENKILYNYKLTDEISETDTLISKKEGVSEGLANNNVIAVYDISLYDTNMNKKSVKNSLINVSIPITGDLVGYDEYKVVYITDEGLISNEEFKVSVEDDYIKFSTTHLSKYGIIGTKKVVVEDDTNLNDVKVTVLYNEEETNETIYATGTDTVKLIVSGVEKFKTSYALKEKKSTDEVEYLEYSDIVDLSSVVPYKELVLLVKVIVGDESKEFELNTIKVYDQIVEYDRNVTYNYDTESDDYNPLYESSDEEQHILLKDVTELDSESEEVTEEEKIVDSIDESSSSQIWINGNVYVVDKADLSDLYFNGTLYIDTDKEIDLATISSEESEKLDSMAFEKIVITTKEFNLNGNPYTYEVDEEGNVTIFLVKDKEEETEEQTDSIVDTDNWFDMPVSTEYDEENDNLVINFERMGEDSLLDTEEEQEPEKN